MSTYLYIQNCNPFIINKSLCFAGSTLTPSLTPRTPGLIPSPRKGTKDLYIQSHNSFIMSIYLYIQNDNPFIINGSLYMRRGTPNIELYHLEPQT